MGDKTDTSLIGDLGFDYKLTANNRNGSEMTLVFSRETGMKDMLEKFKLILQHFGFADCVLEYHPPEFEGS